MLDVQSILNDPKYQREAQRRIAQSRASSLANMRGTWKEKAVNAAFLSASGEQARRQFQDLQVGAKKLRAQEALNLSRARFNASMGLRREAATRDTKDSRIADVVSGAGVLAAGYAANKKSKATTDMTNELRRLTGLYVTPSRGTSMIGGR